MINPRKPWVRQREFRNRRRAMARGWTAAPYDRARMITGARAAGLQLLKLPAFQALFTRPPWRRFHRVRPMPRARARRPPFGAKGPPDFVCGGCGAEAWDLMPRGSADPWGCIYCGWEQPSA